MAANAATSKNQRPVPLMLRLDGDVHRRIVARAAQLDRSMNWTINDMLRTATRRLPAEGSPA